ncbi:hypothetical protein AKJ43_03305 [candidate division MSBL1 archaeon SCGC-AAA261D19]|uniref:Uncharacterized protein n=1 Tax=candidate division MSBL1 archaeon SCGC-AAA261D19 TaxID=1698273 RepID=A0A133V501_9EURY|nr:hypothetical protein AKJ43_03305 [candidate division MSBL1 archaeon SCGC-AAA261D19]
MSLNQEKSYELIQEINHLLDKRVEHQMISEFGSKSKIRTMIREEATKLGQFLRGEKVGYKPIEGTIIK